MSVSYVVIKAIVLSERTAALLTREAVTLLAVRVGCNVLSQANSRLKNHAAHCTRVAATFELANMDLDVLLHAISRLRGRTAQVARQARRGFNTPNIAKFN